jgi:ribosomal protein S7
MGLNSVEDKKKFILKLNNKKYYIGLKINSRQLYFFYKLVNNLIINGKKDKAVSILYTVLLSFYLRNEDPFFIIDKAIRCSILVVKIKKKRIAGRVHQVPLFLQRVNQINYSLKSFIDCIRLRSEKTMILKLFFEIKAINERDFSAVVWRKKKSLYTQAIANKFYVKYL